MRLSHHKRPCKLHKENFILSGEKESQWNFLLKGMKQSGYPLHNCHSEDNWKGETRIKWRSLEEVVIETKIMRAWWKGWSWWGWGRVVGPALRWEKNFRLGAGQVTVLWTVHLLSFTRQSKLNLKSAAWRQAVNTESGAALSMPSLPVVCPLKLDSMCKPPKLTGVSFLPHGSVLRVSRARMNITENKERRSWSSVKTRVYHWASKILHYFVFELCYI